jgi:hypothetical protein
MASIPQFHREEVGIVYMFDKELPTSLVLSCYCMFFLDRHMKRLKSFVQ